MDASRRWSAADDAGYHDDARREYAYGPAAGGLPETHVGTFPDTLMALAKKDGWVVISMQKDWKRIFSLRQVTRSCRTKTPGIPIYCYPDLRVFESDKLQTR
jgi:hypothetical protein